MPGDERNLFDLDPALDEDDDLLDDDDDLSLFERQQDEREKAAAEEAQRVAQAKEAAKKALADKLKGFDLNAVLSEARAQKIELELQRGVEALKAGMSGEEYDQAVTYMARLTFEKSLEAPVHGGLTEDDLAARTLDARAEHEIWKKEYQDALETYGEDSAVAERSAQKGLPLIAELNSLKAEAQRRVSVAELEEVRQSVAVETVTTALQNEQKAAIEAASEDWEKQKLAAEYSVPVDQREDFQVRIDAARAEAEQRHLLQAREGIIENLKAHFPATDSGLFGLTKGPETIDDVKIPTVTKGSDLLQDDKPHDFDALGHQEALKAELGLA